MPIDEKIELVEVGRRNGHSTNPRHYIVFKDGTEWSKVCQFFGTSSPAALAKMVLKMVEGRTGSYDGKTAFQLIKKTG